MSLFELARIFSLIKESNDDENGTKKPQIHQHCWKEVGEKNTLALFFSNDTLVLLSDVSANQGPITRLLPWFPKDPIQTMCFDPSASWLLCSNLSGSVYIVPVATIIEPKAKVAGDWSTSDVTKLHISAKKGCVTCIVWWQTLTGQHIALVATKLGFVVLVSLEGGSVLMESDVGEHVVSIALISNDSQSMTYALITTKGQKQWKLLLECQVDQHKPKNSGWEALNMGFEVVESVNTILNQNDNSSNTDFIPLRFHQFSSSVILSAQYAKGRHFVAAHNLKKSIYEVYESSLEHSALYAFRIPETVEGVVFTDRFLFLSTVCEDSLCVLVMSNQLAEGATEEYKGHNQKAVLHEFHLPANERILFLSKKSFPFYYHDDSDDDLVSSHTVLDGCLVLTSSALYVCRPRASPECIFMEMACQSCQGAAHAETLGIMVGLDVNQLFCLAAQQSLRSKKCSLALTLFKSAKCPAVERVRLLLQNGLIQEATFCLHQLLDTHNRRGHEVTVTEKNLLNTVALPCFLYELVATPSGISRSQLEEKFKSFLLYTFSFDKMEALELILRFQLHDLLLTFALGRGLVADAIKLLIEQNEDVVDNSQLNNDLLLRLLSAIELDELLFQIPESFPSLKNHLERIVSSMNEASLIQCAEIFDPLHYLSRETRSASSVHASYSSDQIPVKLPVSHIVNLFLTFVIVLNVKRKNLEIPLNEIIFNPEEKLLPKPAERELTFRPKLIACGQHHVLMVRDGQCFSWGRASKGALGRDHRLKDYDNQLLKIYGFPSLRTKVTSLSCGAFHCLALTSKGVYAWGGSELGQVGLGSRGSFTQPQMIGGFGDTEVAFLSCGMYHSMAVTKNCKVFTWGWGVFGQLGHGSPEDELRPRLVQSLSGVVKVCGGHAHSVALTAEGVVYTFGCNAFGQLGLEGVVKHSLPVKIEMLDSPVRTIATKHFHNLAVTYDGDVLTWGASPQFLRQCMNMRRRNSSSIETSYRLPSRVDISTVMGAVDSVHCGMSMSGLLTTEGDLYTWGSNLDGQLGLGLNPPTASFMQPHLLRNFDDPLYTVAMGSSFVIAMDTESTLFGWGSTEFGQLASIKAKGPRQRSTISLHSKDEHAIITSPKRIEIRNSGRQDKRVRQNSGNSSQVHHTSEWMLKETDILKSCKLTDLRGSNEQTPYGPSVVLKAVELFPKDSDIHAAISISERFHSWTIAAQLCQYREFFSEAFSFFTKALNELSLPDEKFTSGLLDCFENEIKCLSLSINTVKWKHQQRELMLSEVVDQFVEKKVRIPDNLEAFLRNNIDDMALSVHLVNSSRRIFSSTLLVDITDVLIGQLANQPEMAYEICKSDALDLPVKFDIKENVTYQKKVQEMSEMSCSPRILLSNVEVQSTNIVIFSCGHHASPEEFSTKTLVDFEETFRDKFPQLEQTLSAILKAYRCESDRVIHLACPSCVGAMLSAQFSAAKTFLLS